MDEFGDIVRRFMEERGVSSIRGLARLIGRSDSYTGRVISGERPRNVDLARRVDDVLGAGGEITAAASRQAPPPAEEVHVPQELIDYFASQLTAHYEADRYAGPGTFIPVAQAQHKVAAEYAGKAKGTDRAALEAAAAGFAGLLGWLYQDAGKMAESARWHGLMADHAQRSGDEQLAAFAAQATAFMRADMGDAAAVLDLTGEALAGRSRLAPKVVIHLLQQRAHGLTLAGGDGDEALRLLDEAEGFMGEADDGRPWGTAVNSPRFIDVQRATVWTRLGDAREALALLDDLLPDIPAGRDRGVFLARRALNLALSGEPDEAVAVARDVIPFARMTGSARMRRELGVLRDRMVPFPRQGRELAEAMTGLRKGR
jgi:hypothetical protein